MKLSREKIQRMIEGGTSGGGGGGMSSAALESLLAMYATRQWVNDNFLTKEFFDAIFQLYNNQTKIEPNGELPTDRSRLNIKAMFGFWTEFYISALGNGGQASAAIYLSGLADVQLSSPSNGQALVYNSTLNKWVNGNATSGTVTNIQTGTGLSGGPITSTGTISISSTYQTYISHGETAYGWGNHANAGYATQQWVNDNFLTNEFFDTIFQLYNNQTKIEPNGELPTDRSRLNIKAMFGFWTEFYISALGNGGQASAAIYLSGLADVQLSSPSNGQALVYNSTLNKWVNGNATSGTVTNIQTGTGLSGGPITSTGTISISSTYQTYISHGETAYGWGNHANAGYATEQWVTNNFLALAGGAMDAGARISASGGNLYIGNSDNSGWLMFQDCCSQNGSSYWKIYANGGATFANVLSNGYVTALSDVRLKNITGRFTLDADTIAKVSIIRFTWKDKHDEEMHVGGIAQEWQKILPEAVVEDEAGRLAMDYAAVSYVSVVSLAQKVVSQQREIDEMKAKYEALEKRFARLEEMFNKM